MSTTVVIPPDRPLDAVGPQSEREYRPRSRKFEKTILENGPNEHLDCWGYQSTVVRSILYHCVGLMTAGIGYLIFSWFPTWRLTIFKSPSSLQDADIVLIKDPHNAYYAYNIFYKIITSNIKWISPELAEFGMLTADVHAKKYGTSAKKLSLELLTFKEDLKSSQVSKDTSVENCSQPPKICSIRYFDHQHDRFLWCPQQEIFKRISGVAANLHCRDIYGRSVGISDEARQQKLSAFGPNVIDIEVKSVFRLLIEEVLNPFYCFQVFCIILWCLDDYYIYASCVLAVSIFGISLNLYETRKQRYRLREMVLKSSTKQKFMVLRMDGEFAERDPDLLVPGDVIAIPQHGCTVPCDAILIAGNCIVNEGVLTGESAPVTKVALNSQDAEVFSFEEHKRHVLFHGTSVIQTRYYEGARALAVVCQTGFYTVKGDLVRSILFPRLIGFKFYRDALRLVGVMAGIAGIGMIYSIYNNIERERMFPDPDGDGGFDFKKIIVRALDLITIVVPPALPAALTVGIVYSQRRLKKSGIFCISPSRINACGKIKLVCFDKTGTLTEEGLDLMGVIPTVDGTLTSIAEDVEQLSPADLIVVGMATCHSLTMIDGKLSGDPLDVKLFEATKWSFNEPQQREEGVGAFNTLFPVTVSPPSPVDRTPIESPERHIGIVHQFPFSSGLQRMSVITRDPNEDHFRLYVKGAPEKIVALSKPTTIPANFHKVLHFYAHQGYRVIAMGYRDLDYRLAYHQLSRLKRETVETEINFVGLLVMQNSLKDETVDVISELNAANIQTVMVTGDNLMTAVSVARKCGMVGEEENIVMVDVMSPDEITGARAHILWRYADSAYSASEAGSFADADSDTGSAPSRAVSAHEFCIAMKHPQYHFAMNGRSFSALVENFPELVPKILVQGAVFARFSPDQKTELVEKYIDLDYITAMVGDGANDCGALKAAHAGISLSEAEASVASPFTSNKNTIECVPCVIKEGRCALVTSFGVFKYMALYSIVQFVATLIAYQKGTILADPHFLYLDLFITTTVAILMGYTQPFPNLIRQRPSASLMSPNTIASILMHMVIVVGFQAVTIVSLENQPWFELANNGTETEEIKMCWETTVLVIVAAFQDLILAFVFSKGPPYRQPIYTNVYFLCALVFLAGVTTVLLMYVPGWLQWFLQVVYDFNNPHTFYRLFLLGLMATNFVTAFVLEEFMIDRTWFKRVIRALRRKKASKSRFKLVRRELLKKPNWPPVGETTYTKVNDDSASLSSSDAEPKSTRL
ncbi:polyamine-transporting ATPase 13A2-like [Paramacrobiotus metropolitanus]|uniref:polyamine-transporting ATPase 13A2-like n=1 Tax=Paramacrobiotus metropolitanus TaxID=2943436 RepID=UPI002445FD52|nr:polyamine-transporting ATPase 13A2-like [Paramacrobiotus metropolitanus]